jgi:hypothetical protein
MTTTFFRRFAEETRRSIGSMTRLAIVIAAVKTHVADLTLCVGPSMMPTFNPRRGCRRRRPNARGTTTATRGRRLGDVADESDAVGV